MSHESKTRPVYSCAERAAFIVKQLKSGLNPDDMRHGIEGELRACESDAFERGRIHATQEAARIARARNTSTV